jgi:hypothetical protein
MVSCVVFLTDPSAPSPHWHHPLFNGAAGRRFISAVLEISGACVLAHRGLVRDAVICRVCETPLARVAPSWPQAVRLIC